MGLPAPARGVNGLEFRPGVILEFQEVELARAEWAVGVRPEPALVRPMVAGHERLRIDGGQVVLLDAPRRCPRFRAGSLWELAQVCQRGRAAVRDTRRLLRPPKSEHRVKRERSAEPLGANGHDLEIERRPRFRLWMSPRFINGPDIALRQGVNVQLLVVAQLSGTAKQRRPVSLYSRDLRRGEKWQFDLQRRRKQQVRSLGPRLDLPRQRRAMEKLGHGVQRQVVDHPPIDELLFVLGGGHQLPGFPWPKDARKRAAR